MCCPRGSSSACHSEARTRSQGSVASDVGAQVDELPRRRVPQQHEPLAREHRDHACELDRVRLALARGLERLVRVDEHHPQRGVEVTDDDPTRVRHGHVRRARLDQRHCPAGHVHERRAPFALHARTRVRTRHDVDVERDLDVTDDLSLENAFNDRRNGAARAACTP